MKWLASFTTICFLFVFLIFLFNLSPVLGLHSLNIFPPSASPYNQTYSDHSKNFWKWSLALPAKDNPINDPTGDKCAAGQSNSNSSVFYLTFNNGGKSERTCEVPIGKGLLIPVMQVEISDKDIPGSSIEDQRTAVKKDQDSVNSLYLKIGDKEYGYQDLLKYRIQPTDPFEVLYADNGIFGIAKGGPAKVVADGYYILTEPLKKGTYPIHFKSSLLCPDLGCAEPNFAQDITYTIIAK